MSLDNLPEKYSEISKDDLMRLTGQKFDRYGIDLPSLRVNYDDEDGAGNKIPRGEWTITTDDGVKVFAPVVAFRVMYTTYQYSHYDADEQKTISTSVHFRNFKEKDIPDDAGGQRCGRIPRKQWDSLSDAECKVQKQKKLAKVMFGLVSLDGANIKGESVKLDNIPCVFYARGTHYWPMNEYMKRLAEDNVWSAEMWTTLSLEREKNGGVVYWVVVPERGKAVKTGQKDFENIRLFGETVDAENKTIVEKHDRVHNKAGDASLAQVVKATEQELPFDDPIQDLIEGQSDDISLGG